MEREFECLRQRLLGKWEGQVHAEMGGYPQKLEFYENGEVSTRVAEIPEKIGNYSFRRDPEISFPIVEIKFPQISDYVVPYIVKFEQQHELHLCCPFLTDQLPRSFQGPGHVVMRKIESEISAGDFRVYGSIERRTKQYLKEVIEILLRMDSVETSFASEDTANRAAITLISTLTKMDSLVHKFGPDVLDFLDARTLCPASDEIDALHKLLKKLCATKGVAPRRVEKEKTGDNISSRATAGSDSPGLISSTPTPSGLPLWAVACGGVGLLAGCLVFLAGWRRRGAHC